MAYPNWQLYGPELHSFRHSTGIIWNSPSQIALVVVYSIVPLFFYRPLRNTLLLISASQDFLWFFSSQFVSLWDRFDSFSKKFSLSSLPNEMPFFLLFFSVLISLLCVGFFGWWFVTCLIAAPNPKEENCVCDDKEKKKIFFPFNWTSTEQGKGKHCTDRD